MLKARLLFIGCWLLATICMAQTTNLTSRIAPDIIGRSIGGTGEIFVTGSGGIKLGGERRTTWPSGGGAAFAPNTNFYLMVDSAYGASGWRYASAPQGPTASNLCSFTQNETSTASNAPSFMFLRTYQINQQSRRCIARIWAGELTNALNQIQIISKLQNTNDQLIIRFNDISGNNFIIFTNGASFYLTSNSLKTNTINASTNACFTILPNPYIEVVCDAYTTGTNLNVTPNDSMLPIINVSRIP